MGLKQAMLLARQGQSPSLTLSCKAWWWQRASQMWRLMKRTWAGVDYWAPLGQGQ